MPRFILPLFLAACLQPGVHAQTLDQPSDHAPATNMQGAWDARANATRAGQWREASNEAPANAALLWNWFRTELDARRSAHNGDLLPADKQELEAIAGRIAGSTPDGFERHMARYFLDFPAPGAFAELEAAHRMAPGRPELIAPMVTWAMRTGDDAALLQWCTALRQRGQVAPALASVAQDVLRSLPTQAVLFTNGDMDTQPVVMDQVLGTTRPGVLVVDRRLLADRVYRARVWREAEARGTPPPSAGPAFAIALLQATARPVYFALSLDRDWLEAFPGQLHVVGAAFRVGAASPDDVDLLARNWKAMRKTADAGPMSRNYLLPGAVLLGRLRQAGDERGAARVEADLRRIAAATGATAELRQMGILQH